MRKYLLGLAVVAYIFSVIGVPVYLHYCGGELEKINFLVKTSSCCGGEEDDELENDCCKDEGAYVQNTTDFTFKTVSYFIHLPGMQLFTCPAHFEVANQFLDKSSVSGRKEIPPNPSSRSIISTSVLRI